MILRAIPDSPFTCSSLLSPYYFWQLLCLRPPASGSLLPVSVCLPFLFLKFLNLKFSCDFLYFNLQRHLFFLSSLDRWSFWCFEFCHLSNSVVWYQFHCDLCFSMFNQSYKHTKHCEQGLYLAETS